MSTETQSQPRKRNVSRANQNAAAKANTTAAVAEPPSFTVKQKKQVDKNVVYRIPRGGGIVFMIQQRGVTVYDEAENKVRTIRYCPQEPSIYVDEQSDNAVKEAVIFRDGMLLVPKEKPNLQAYLNAHPDNIANGGNVFEMVNETKKASETLEREFSISEAVDMVRDKSIQDLLPVAIYFGVNVNRETAEIRYDLLQIAKKTPNEFIESFGSPIVMARAAMQQASDFQIINVKSNGVYWFDSNSLIVSVPVGQNGLEVASRFCLTEKGITFYEDIKDRLNKLN